MLIYYCSDCPVHCYFCLQLSLYGKNVIGLSRCPPFRGNICQKENEVYEKLVFLASSPQTPDASGLSKFSQVLRFLYPFFYNCRRDFGWKCPLTRLTTKSVDCNTNLRILSWPQSRLQKIEIKEATSKSRKDFVPLLPAKFFSWLIVAKLLEYTFNLCIVDT